MTDKTPEQLIGEVAANALAWVDGRTLIAAVVIVAVDDGDLGQWWANAPDGQPYVATRGLVESYRDTLRLADSTDDEED